MKHWEAETVTHVEHVIWMGMPYRHVHTIESGDAPHLDGPWLALVLFDAITWFLPAAFNGAWLRYTGSYWSALWTYLKGDAPYA